MSRVIPLFHSSFPSTPHQGKTLPISRTCMKNQWNNLVVLLRSVTCSMQNWYISKPHMSRPSLHIGQSVVSYTVATLGTENRTVFLWKLVLTAELSRDSGPRKHKRTWSSFYSSGNPLSWPLPLPGHPSCSEGAGPDLSSLVGLGPGEGRHGLVGVIERMARCLFPRISYVNSRGSMLRALWKLKKKARIVEEFWRGGPKLTEHMSLLFPATDSWPGLAT